MSIVINTHRLLSALYTIFLHLSSVVFYYVTHVTTNLRWACKFLVRQSLFQHQPQLNNAIDDIISSNPIMKRYKYYNSGGQGEGEEEEECAVCLCKLEEGEEVMELRCSHMFHRECLGRWVGYRNMRATCPLCRDSLAVLSRFLNRVGDQLVIFKFSSLNSRERDAWWLR